MEILILNFDFSFYLIKCVGVDFTLTESVCDRLRKLWRFGKRKLIFILCFFLSESDFRR